MCTKYVSKLVSYKAYFVYIEDLAASECTFVIRNDGCHLQYNHAKAMSSWWWVLNMHTKLGDLFVINQAMPLFHTVGIHETFHFGLTHSWIEQLSISNF
jgi:hypothetical protein